MVYPIATDTLACYDQIMAACQATFHERNKDYGSVWRVFCPLTFVDQTMIKGSAYAQSKKKSNKQ